jgi:uncharacterized RDD family membrane protein YckC
MTTGTGDPVARASWSAVPGELRQYHGQHAGLVSRALASGVDFAIAIAALLAGYGLAIIVWFLLRPRSFRLPTVEYQLALPVGVAVFVLYLAVSWWRGGRSLGDRLLGLRVADTHGKSVGIPRALARGMLCVAVPVGLLWVVLDKKNRSLQDLVLRTFVVYDWSSRRRRMS